MNCIKLTFWIQFHRPPSLLPISRFPFQVLSQLFNFLFFPRNFSLQFFRVIFFFLLTVEFLAFDTIDKSNRNTISTVCKLFYFVEFASIFFPRDREIHFNSFRRISLPRTNRQSILRILFHRGNRKPALTIILTIPLLHLFKSLLPPNF